MNRTAAIRVVVGEDQPIFRDGLVHILKQEGFDVLGAWGNASELLAQILALAPDVVISDIQMPPHRTDDGLQAVLEARQAHPEMGVLMLSQYLDASYVIDLVADNAHGVGYLLKEKVADIAILVDAVNRVAAGGTALDPDVIEALVSRPRKPGPLDSLTRRERTVLELIAQGLSNASIAQTLEISTGAVERHVAHIYAKLGLREGRGDHRRVLAVLEFLKQ
jgi:DNA-binding NarL/FixJ family response regulator